MNKNNTKILALKYRPRIFKELIGQEVIAETISNAIKLKIMSEEMDTSILGEKIVGTLKTIFDPEIPVDIYELGLIYDVLVNEDFEVKILMTLTTPNCPVAESLPKEVKEGAMQVDGIDDVDLQLVWDPPWTKDMMSDAAKLELNL